jgi:uncharacterized membrane protein YtjA (UPF0391 family)
MRLIPASFHRILDFVTVVAFALIPSILGWTGMAAALSYVLAVVHLAMTMLTRFASTERRPVSLGLHGIVEAVVGIALVVLPSVAPWGGTPRAIFTAAGVTILVVRVLSQYRWADSAGSLT